MRLCRNCRKFNAGEPLRCRYCRAGLVGRLCPRNHINPVDSGVAFCGDCGEPLERTCGAGSSTTPVIALAVGGLMLIVLVSAILSNEALQGQLLGMVAVLTILVL